MPTVFTYISDFLMISASLGAAIYCLILSRRLSRLTSFDQGIGGAIAVLSAQVDEMKSALAEAKSGSEGAGRHLHELVHQARDISGELELMIAACHDFAEEALVVQGQADPPAKAQTNAAQEPGDLDEFSGTDEAGGPEPGAEPALVFGSRRTRPADPVFRHHRTVEAG